MQILVEQLVRRFVEQRVLLVLVGIVEEVGDPIARVIQPVGHVDLRNRFAQPIGVFLPRAEVIDVIGIAADLQVGIRPRGLEQLAPSARAC